MASFAWCSDGKSCQTVGLVVRLQRNSTGNIRTYSEAPAPEELSVEINVYRNLMRLQILETYYMCICRGNLQPRQLIKGYMYLTRGSSKGIRLTKTIGCHMMPGPQMLHRKLPNLSFGVLQFWLSSKAFLAVLLTFPLN